MLYTDGLKDYLQIAPQKNAPAILIYSPLVSSRLRFVARYIFRNVLNCNVEFTTDQAVFSAAKTIKINYSRQNIDGAFHILPGKFLFETGVSDTGLRKVIKDGMFYLQAPGDDNFDVFAAVFFMVSRYEEWQHFKPDRHERFEAAQSILYEQGFLLKPVVESWIGELKTQLQEFYNVKFPSREFRVVSTIDVDNLFAYKQKGLARTLAAAIKDLVKLDLANLRRRLLVVGGRRSDPFDVYQEIADFCFTRKIPLIFFFLFRSGNRYDRTVRPASGAFEAVFEKLKKHYAFIGLHPSYYSARQKSLVEYELAAIRRRSRLSIEMSRQHYLRFHIRTTPQLLLDCGIRFDFTTGFASRPGFRAGTSVPFYHYDFISEKETELLMVPFCAMDGAFAVYSQTDCATALNILTGIAEELKKVNGIFISVFHERSFSDHLYKGMGTLYKNLHLRLKELQAEKK